MTLHLSKMSMSNHQLRFAPWVLIILTLARSASAKATTACVAKEDSLPNCLHTFSDVDSALDFVGNTTDSVRVVVYPGKYYLSSDVRFVFSTNIVIEGETPNTAQIECRANAGISFENSSYISLQHMDMLGCGARHNIGDNKFVQVAIYFQQCSHVTLDHMRMLDGIGVGVVFYACNGSNVIHSSLFNNSHPPNSRDSFYSGGIHIGYPYCFLEESSNDCSSFVPEESTSLAFYNISECNFTDNSAGDYYNAGYTYSLPEKIKYYIEGCGGGLLVFFMGDDTTDNTILVDSCLFDGNKGIYGGGALVSVGDKSRNNIVQFSNTEFTNNNASADGGGVKIDFYVTTSENVNNSVSFCNCLFQNNNASTGGGLSLHGAKQDNMTLPRNSLLFNECVWLSNSAILGTALGLTLWHPLDIGSEPNISFTECKFIENDADRYYAFGRTAGMATIYVNSIRLYFAYSLYFSRNNGTSIYAVNSKIEFLEGCNSTFEYNTGITGGVFCLIGTSYIKVNQHTVFNFTGNRASNLGNVMYALLPSHHDTLSPKSSLGNCFIQYSNPHMPPNEWKTDFYFTDNTEYQHESSIFATSFMPCVWGKASDSISQLLAEVFCWNQTWHYSNGNCSGQVKSLASYFNMSDRGILSVKAGEAKFMNITAYDDQNENVTELLVLTTDVGHDSNIQVVDTYRYISDNMIQFKQLNQTTDKTTVNIQTLFPRILQARVEVEVDPCPPAYEVNKEGFCECSKYHSIILCGSDLSAKIQRSFWVGMYNISQNEKVSLAGYCSSCTNQDFAFGDYVAIPLSIKSPPGYKCPNHTTGPLCSVCERKYGLSVRYHRCVSCPESGSAYIWIVYFLYTYIPITFLFYILFFTNFSLASRHLNAAIFFTQMITYPMNADQNGIIPIKAISPTTIDSLFAIQEILFGVWNLDFCAPCLQYFCLSSDINHVNPLMAIKYMEAFFPLFFVVIIFACRHLNNMNSTCVVKVKNFFASIRPLRVCWYRFGKRLNFSVSESLRNVIASCVILAYTRCVLITSRILSLTFLRNKDGQIKAYVPTFDQSTGYLHDGHVYYFVLAILMSVVFLIPVPVILIFFRFDENAVAGRRSESYLNILLEIFQRSFKYKSHVQPYPCTDINEDNRIVSIRPKNSRLSFWRKHNCGNLYDCRWVPGVYFALRSFMVLASLLPVMLSLLIQQLLCLVMMLVFLVFQPYKNDWNNKLDGFILSLMVIINGINIYQYYLTVTNLSLSVPAFILQYLLSYIPFFWIVAYIMVIIVQAFKRARCMSRTAHFFGELHAEVADDNSQYEASAEEHSRCGQQQHVKCVTGSLAINRQPAAEREPPEQAPLLEGEDD